MIETAHGATENLADNLEVPGCQICKIKLSARPSVLNYILNEQSDLLLRLGDFRAGGLYTRPPASPGRYRGSVASGLGRKTFPMTPKRGPHQLY